MKMTVISPIGLRPTLNGNKQSGVYFGNTAVAFSAADIEVAKHALAEMTLEKPTASTAEFRTAFNQCVEGASSRQISEFIADLFNNLETRLNRKIESDQAAKLIAPLLGVTEDQLLESNETRRLPESA